MEDIQNPVDNFFELNGLFGSYEYKLKLDNEIYLLKMELHLNDNTISFKIRELNNISIYYYKEYKYDKLLIILLLNKEIYDNISKIYEFCDTAIKNKKIKLIKNKDNKIALLLKNYVDFKEIGFKIDLIEIKVQDEKNKNINIISNEKSQIKLKENRNENIIRNNNIIIKEEIKNKKNENKEIKMNLLNDKANLLSEENKNLNNKLIINESLFNEKREEKYNLIKPTNNNIFVSNPQNLKFKKILTNNALANFDVYIGLKDHIEYLIFNNIKNYNLDIMRIKDTKIITSLEGHQNRTRLIKYYLKDNKEDYILSYDENNLVIIWDIQNNFNKKYNIQVMHKGFISHSLLLFNIFNNNYIVLSFYVNNEYNKLLEFKEKNKFVKNIYGTNNHSTFFMIPWTYQNKHYIIDLCDNQISINNIFEDENYAILTKEPECKHYSGSIYNDNYLCVNDDKNNFVRIWDLVKKTMYKEIKYEATYGDGLIQWNNNYTIIGCRHCLVVINLEESIAKKITFDDFKIKPWIMRIQKIKLNQFDECLICSNTSFNIYLFSL